MNRNITIGEYKFDEENHVHTLGGKNLTGVTTILAVIAKPALIQWSATTAIDYAIANATDKGIEEGEPYYIINEHTLKEAKVAHRKKKEAAGDAGTEIHAEVEHYINHMLEDCDGIATIVNPGYKPQVELFIKWAVDNKVKFLASEKHVHSREWWTGGIADIICEIDGKRYVGDIKTSSGIYPEAFIQGSAYSKMLVEMGEPKHDGIVIINLKKDGGFDVQYNYDIEGNVKCFESALNIYRHMESLKK